MPPKGLQAVLDGSTKKLVVADISVGGISVLAEKPVPRNTIYVVHLTFGRINVTRRVRTAHCRKRPNGWLIGWAFVSEARKAGPTIEDLLDALMGSLITFSY